MKSIETKVVQDQDYNSGNSGSLLVPVYKTSTYIFKNSTEILEYTSGNSEHFEYGRYGNPTQVMVEKKLASLEKCEEALLFPSGMNAITTAILSFIKSGDHIIISDDSYKKTYEFVTSILPDYGAEYTVIPYGDYQSIIKAIKKNTKLLFFESPTNPYLNIADFSKLKKIKNDHNIVIMVDSTFATPINIKPVEYDIDLIIHSATKYLSGHNDMMAGVVCGSAVNINKVKSFRDVLGGILSPDSCFLLNRGLKTLDIRIKKLNKSALKVAKFLEKQELVKKVYYPGLKSHQNYNLAKKYMSGFGAVVTFELGIELEKVKLILDNFKLCKIGPSFGGAETLITHPGLVSYYMYSKDERYSLGIKDGLFRLSVGLENPDDIIFDLQQAFIKPGKCSRFV